MRSSELAEKLNLSPSAVKRWAREFLPLDPKAKMRSGYTREFNIEAAFEVALGGHLVSDLKFEVFEAKMIISALRDYLRNYGIYPGTEPADPIAKQIRNWEINIVRNSNTGGFEFYCIGVISDEMGPSGTYIKEYKKLWVRTPNLAEKEWMEKNMSFKQSLPLLKEELVVHVLRISVLREFFLKNLEI